MSSDKKKIESHAKRVWKFFWDDDSVWSWLLNIVVAIVLIKFVVYPLLGLALGTSYPIVAVVSESMEHSLYNGALCGNNLVDYQESFDNYWKYCGDWYEQRGITKEQFQKFSFKNGFNKGDVILLWKAKPDNVAVGDILIFQGNKPQPIIHRVIKGWNTDGKYYYQTKGDHNSDSFPAILEDEIGEERLLGKGLIRIPYLGWLKILFVDLVKPLGINIQR
ncbi:MAG: signal peptidase I [Nanoarchaeota archaeon]|nr:signal peptidase I [Nanoarchaeota archaeon]MBU1644656.1 signal peptidase I [Nanoarchaeota archaeon]MBU1976973.1 signal peptidase I [Nanoarchaeota archaeon]